MLITTVSLLRKISVNTSLYLHQRQTCKCLKLLERKIGAMCPRPNQRENENQSRALFADRVYTHTFLAFQLGISPNPINWTRGNQ